MDKETFLIEDGVEVAPSPVLKPLRNKGYGSIPDLPDEELANPDELQRCVVRAELEPVLLLPKPKPKWYSPAWDVHSDVDFNAFASIDFERIRPEFDKARYKADKLREELRDLVISIEILNERIKSRAKYKVLKLVKMKVMDVDDISDFDMWIMAKRYLRALRLKKQILALRKKSRQRKAEQLQEWLDSLG